MADFVLHRFGLRVAALRAGIFETGTCYYSIIPFLAGSHARPSGEHEVTCRSRMPSLGQNAIPK